MYRSVGPNHLWYIDGYDKLKPHGLPIYGAIDGYSRRLMWLKVRDLFTSLKPHIENVMMLLYSVIYS